MPYEKGVIHVVDVEAGADVPPEGHLLYARDTDDVYKSDGTTLTAIGGGAAYTNEEAQDAVGTILVDSSTIDFTYTDATPEITAIVIDNSITDAKLRNSSALSVIGRSANSAGDPADIAGATVGHVLQVLSGPTVGFGGLGTTVSQGLYSWDYPPQSPSAYDDEFDSGTLDAKWTIASAGTTNPAVAGTIDYTASLTTPIVDAASVPSRLMFQSDNSSGATFRVSQTFTQATDETHFIKILANQRNVNVNGEGAFYLELSNSGDANEIIAVGTTNSGTLHDVWAYVNNNGVSGGVSSGYVNEGSKATPTYIVIWKKSNDYYIGIAGEDKGSFNVFTIITKTGVTTFDTISLIFFTANETPSVIEGVDFYRYKDSLDYSLLNPPSVAAGTIPITSIGDVTDDRLLGRSAGSDGVMQEITVGTGLDLNAGALDRAALTGDVTASAGSNATTIANDAVTFAKMQNVSSNILLGKGIGGPGDIEEITMGTNMDLQFGALVCTIEKRKVVGVTFDGNGSTPTVGSIGYVVATFSGDIENWYITSDVSGSAVVDVWKVNGAIPTNANSISTVDKPTLSSQQLNSDGTLAGWSDTTCTYGDVFGFELESVSTCNRVTVQITYVEQ